MFPFEYPPLTLFPLPRLTNCAEAKEEEGEESTLSEGAYARAEESTANKEKDQDLAAQRHCSALCADGRHEGPARARDGHCGGAQGQPRAASHAATAAAAAHLLGAAAGVRAPGDTRYPAPAHTAPAPASAKGAPSQQATEERNASRGSSSSNSSYSSTGSRPPPLLAPSRAALTAPTTAPLLSPSTPAAHSLSTRRPTHSLSP